MQDRVGIEVCKVPPKVGFEDAWKFIVEVGLAAHRYGSTAGRLEGFLTDLSAKFGYEGAFRSTPSDIVFGLRETPASPQRLELISTPAPGVDLDKLARLGYLLQEVQDGKLSLAESSARLDAIEAVPPAWGAFASMLGYAFTGMGLVPILGGGWSDVVFATLFSILVYGIVLLSARLGPLATGWLPFTSAFIVAVLATAVKVWVPDLNLVLVILSAVAIILPGYTISLGAGELVAGHIASGAGNLMTGLICLVKQVAGGFLGVVGAGVFVPMAGTGGIIPVAPIWLWLFVPVIILGLCLAFQTSRRDLPWAALVCGIAYLGTMEGNALLDSNLGNLVGTVIAVIASNLWGRQTGRPSSIVLIPAIVLLVSGSIGFRGLVAMAEGQLMLGAQEFLQMFVVALTIFFGILIGFMVVRPEPGL
jgi:uncharacterized membrane protein YjjP (DUF1212 family)